MDLGKLKELNIFSKRNLIVVGLVFLVILTFGVYKYLNVRLSLSNSDASVSDLPELYFSPTRNLNVVAVGEEFTVNIDLKTNSAQRGVSAVELYVVLPSSVQAVSMVKGSFLPVELAPASVGGAGPSIILGSNPASPALGTGTIAVLTLRAVAPLDPSQITFGSNTKVAAVGFAENTVGSMRSLVFSVGAPLIAPGPITVPPADLITSLDGNIQVGVSRRYGGAIVYYKDRRITDSTVANGNIIDYSNGGTLLTTAIWTLPHNVREMGYCFDNQKVRGSCPASEPFNNPTQGGFFGHGWIGNPNPTTVTVENNIINVSYRSVNYNYGYSPVRPLLEANKNEWQTDFWGEVKIYFHPILKDVVVTETKIIYCKDNNIDCRNKTITAQDTQLSTLFAAGQSHPDPSFRGPYTRPIYPSGSAGSIRPLSYRSGGEKIRDNFENWVGIFQTSQDVGIGMSIPNTRDSFQYAAQAGALVDSVVVTQPSLVNFEHSGVSESGNVNEAPRFLFNPGGWFKFKTYLATGGPEKIRWDLTRAQDNNFSDSATLPIRASIKGNIDTTSCSLVQGWTTDERDTSSPISVRVEIYPEASTISDYSRIATGEANVTRSDLVGQCSNGSCGFAIPIGDLISGNGPGKFRARAYGITADGQNRLSLANIGISSIGPCGPPAISDFSGGGGNANTNYFLRWSVSNATSISIDNGIGDVTNRGGYMVIRPTQNTTYTITASNSSGTVTRQVNVIFVESLRNGSRIVTNKMAALRNNPTESIPPPNGYRSQPQGSKGVIVDGPVTGPSYPLGIMWPWWKIDFETGSDGWVLVYDIEPDSSSSISGQRPTGGQTTIVVRAKGTPNSGQYPNMELRSGNTVLANWNVTGDYSDYTFNSNQALNDNLRVYFTNDAYNSSGDRNLFVDGITINNQKYESEDAGTYAKGVYVSGQGCVAGFAKGETLHCDDSYFEYPTSSPVSTSLLDGVKELWFSNIANIFKW